MRESSGRRVSAWPNWRMTGEETGWERCFCLTALSKCWKISWNRVQLDRLLIEYPYPLFQYCFRSFKYSKTFASSMSKTSHQGDLTPLIARSKEQVKKATWIKSEEKRKSKICGLLFYAVFQRLNIYRMPRIYYINHSLILLILEGWKRGDKVIKGFNPQLEN